MFRIHSVVRACAALGAAVGLVAVACAQAAPAGREADTLWACWYDGDTTFRCRLLRARDEPVDRTPARAREPRRSLYPRRGPLPPVVNTIHEHPGRLRGRTITVPLFSPPIDMRVAVELVEAVMCDVRPECRVRIFRSAAAAAMQYEDDPALEP